LMPLVSVEGEPVTQFEVPDLSSVDKSVVTTPQTGRRTFSPRDLQ